MFLIGEKSRKIFLFSLFIILLFSFSVMAGEISLEQAIRTGLESNYELVQKYREIKDLERERASLEAGIDWTWKVTTNYGYASDRYTNGTVFESGDNLNFTLDGGKITLKGLGINTRFSLTDDEPFAFNNLGEKYQFRLDLSKRLYPLLPTGTEKALIQLDNRISIAKYDLFLAKNRKEMDWLAAYVNLLRLQERIEYSQLRYQLALENLARIENQLEIAETSREQILAAQMAVKEVELQEQQLKNTFMQARESFILETGISGELLLSEDNIYLKNFLEKADAINIELGDEEIDGLLQENNLQLRQIVLNKEYAEKELKWQQEEGKIKVDTFGNYNYDAGIPEKYEEYKSYWEVGVGISYDLYDSGEQKLALEGIKARIDNLEREYDYTLERLKQELEGMYLQYQMDKTTLEIKEISLERARLQEILYKEQYVNGLITENHYEEFVLALRQTELDYKESLDKVRFDKIRIALFLGLN